MSTELVAKSIIVNDLGEVLLLRRSKNDERRPHDWDFPGGGVNDGEAFVDAAAREIKEEVGIKFDANELRLVYLGAEYYEPANLIYFRNIFSAKIKSGQAVKLSFEHDYFEWMSVEQALEKFQHRFYNPALRFASDRGLLKFD